MTDEDHADALGVPGEDQRPPGVCPEGDQAAQFASGVAIAQDLGVVGQRNARSHLNGVRT